MRIITCASYHGTGSSAITDLISEFENCQSLTDYEFRFVQDPNGISDLEYNLVQNPHRLNSGYALKKYRDMVIFLSGNIFIKKYEPYFNNKWKEISLEYINNLTDIVYKGYWHQDLIDKGYATYFYKRLINKILINTIWRNKERVYNELPNELTYCSHPSEEKFLSLTQEYILKLFNEANPNKKPDIMVDQIVPPSNIERYSRYFKDLKVVIVDRDPRDLYILEKYIWKESVIPTNDVQTFCDWFLYTRSHRKSETLGCDHIFIQFEDLVYKYEDTVKKIQSWLNYNDNQHIDKKKYFDPEVSIKNTRLWTKMKINQSEILHIEKVLSEFLYYV